MASTDAIERRPVEDPVHHAHGEMQIQQCSGVLIKLLKLPAGHDGDLTPDASDQDATDEGPLRQPSICWICRRLVQCLSKTLAEGKSAFILMSSSTNCALNHELLIAIRFLLQKTGASPKKITVESATLGPLRLILASEASNIEGTVAAPLVRSGSQSHETTTRNGNTPKTSQVIYKTQLYDLYQDSQAVTRGVPVTWIPRAALIPQFSHSNECLRLAKSWLDECLLEHPKCRTGKIPKLPRRVIDVNDGNLRLCAPRDGTRGHWVALSHCWGSNNTFKTILATLESHVQGISWEQLPNTFKDAVTVTRALGIQYLWIDSLCIIQDDGGVDFHTEAAKMCDIYRNSVLTIAASCSDSDCAGFLGQRMIPDPIKLHKPQIMESVRFRPVIDHSRALRDDPIHSRAWTFQETILPRRLLSFGTAEATWECETLRQCECGQIEYEHQEKTGSTELGRAAYREYTAAVIDGRFRAGKRFELPWRPTPGRPRGDEWSVASDLEVYAAELLADAPVTENQEEKQRFLNSVYEMLLEFEPVWMKMMGYSDAIGSGPDSKLMQEFKTAYMECTRNTCLDLLATKGFYRYWRRILVPEYTRRAVSKDSDRLIALQAIASDVHSGIPDKYLAGMWEGDLANQLCWRSADSRSLPADNESPSWSWASIRGPAIPCLAEESDDDGNFYEMAIESAHCSLAGDNPCGRVLGGSISLQGVAMEVRYIWNKKRGLFEFHAIGFGSEDPNIKVTRPLKMDFSPDTPLGRQADGWLTRSAEDNRVSTRHHSRAMKAMVFFPRCVEGNEDWCALVCGRVSPNTYRRVGIGTLKPPHIAELFSTPEFRVRGSFNLI